MILDDLKTKLRKAKPGQRVQYHRGELAHQRTYMKEVDEIARFIMALHELEAVTLFQKRDAEGVMCYYAQPRVRFRNDRGFEDGVLTEAERMAHAFAN